MKKYFFEVSALLLAVVLFLVPNFIAPICPIKPDGTYMGCYYSGKLVMRFAVFIFMISLAMFLSARYPFTKLVKVVGSIANIVIATLVYAVPHQMIHMTNEIGNHYGFCKMENMECREHHTFEVAGIIAGIIGLLMIANLIYTFLKKD